MKQRQEMGMTLEQQLMRMEHCHQFCAGLAAKAFATHLAEMTPVMSDCTHLFDI